MWAHIYMPACIEPFPPSLPAHVQGKEKESAARIKRFMTIMDSMTAKELDSTNPKTLTEDSRILRIARGSGRHPLEVRELLGESVCASSCGREGSCGGSG